MKIAAGRAIAELARQQVPEEVASAYGRAHSFGPEYIITAPFDPRLMEIVPAAVAQVAMERRAAQKPIEDMAAYRQSPKARPYPTTKVITIASAGARAAPIPYVFHPTELSLETHARNPFPYCSLSLSLVR